MSEEKTPPAEQAGEKRQPRPTLALVKGGLEGLLKRQRAEIERALPSFLKVGVFERIALTTTKNDRLLMESDALSFCRAVMEAAQAGLVLDGVLGHAFLVSFKDNRAGIRVVQMIPGYKGLIHMARRSGEVANVEPRLVYEGDRFDYSYGLRPVLDHRPIRAAERGDITHAYCVLRWRDANIEPAFEVMPVEDIIAIRDASPGYRFGNKKTSPWTTHFGAMALKTVIRMTLKWAPLSVEDQRVIARDELRDARVPEFEVKPSQPVMLEDLAPADDDEQAGPAEAEGDGAEAVEVEAEAGDRAGPQLARACRKVYEAKQAAGVWDAKSFLEDVAIGRLGLMLEPMTLKECWSRLEGMSRKRVVETLNWMQAQEPADEGPATDDENVMDEINAQADADDAAREALESEADSPQPDEEDDWWPKS